LTTVLNGLKLRSIVLFLLTLDRRFPYILSIISLAGEKLESQNIVKVLILGIVELGEVAISHSINMHFGIYIPISYTI